MTSQELEHKHYAEGYLACRQRVYLMLDGLTTALEYFTQEHYLDGLSTRSREDLDEQVAEARTWLSKFKDESSTDTTGRLDEEDARPS